VNSVDLELAEKGIIRRQFFIKYPWDFGSVRMWSRRMGYKYRRYYEGSDLPKNDEHST